MVNCFSLTTQNPLTEKKKAFQITTSIWQLVHRKLVFVETNKGRRRKKKRTHETKTEPTLIAERTPFVRFLKSGAQSQLSLWQSPSKKEKKKDRCQLLFIIQVCGEPHNFSFGKEKNDTARFEWTDVLNEKWFPMTGLTSGRQKCKNVVFSIRKVFTFSSQPPQTNFLRWHADFLKGVIVVFSRSGVLILNLY